MYKRLVTFGCSFTFGQYLEDCVPPNDKYPSSFTWAQLLADNLNLPVSNFSRPGASSKETWKTIIDTQLCSEDLVIIQWSPLDRWCIIEEKYVDYIAPFRAKNHYPSKAFFKFLHNSYDLQTDLNCRSDHISRYLNHLRVNNYHLLWKDEYKDFIEPWNSTNFLPVYINKIRKMFPPALDNSHPGPQAHEEFAYQIFKLL